MTRIGIPREIKPFEGRVGLIPAACTALVHHGHEVFVETAAGLVPGRRTPRLVPREWVARMAPGSVIVDVSVDQGGCIETTRPMSHDEPPYVEEGVLHWCVTNMPGGVPRTSSSVLSAVLAPYVLRLAEPGWEDDPLLAKGINVRAGEYVNEAVRAELG